MRIDVTDYFLSCDWGTSAFRLKLVARNSGEVVAALTTEQGVKKIYDSFELQKILSQEQYFLHFLQTQIDVLSQQYGECLENCKVVVSGMASSSIGLRSLPYATLPFDLNCKHLYYEYITANEHCKQDVFLISGLAKEGDVMRGEEIQVIGLLSNVLIAYENFNVVLPGTHTKQIKVMARQVVDFQTYITGELYEVIQKHTILKNSIESNEIWDRTTIAAFRTGVADSQTHELTQALFKIRAKNLQGTLAKSSAAHYLSGLLIGYECRALDDCSTIFCCETVFQPLYQEALDVLQKQKRAIFLSPDVVSNLVVKGHRVFMDTIQLSDEL